MVYMVRQISGMSEEKEVEADQVEDLLCAGWLVRENDPPIRKALAPDKPKV